MSNAISPLTIASSIIAGGVIVAAVIFTGGVSGGTASVVGSQSGFKEFSIVMENNRYNPSTVTANLGDRVVINLANRDAVSHAVEIPQFNATIPGGHVPANGTARLEFIANKKMKTDAAVCGGPVATDKTDDHGEELIINII